MLDEIAPAEVARWAPAVAVSARVQWSAAITALHDRAPARIRAGAITFAAPQQLLVTGRTFTLVGERGGLVPQSTYLNLDYAWRDLLGTGPRVLPLPDEPLLIAANAAWINYSHWLFQCVAVAAVAALVAPDAAPRALVPPLDPLRRDMLAAIGYGADRLIELPHDAVALPTQGIVTNLLDGDFIPAPHPAIGAAFEAATAALPRSPLAGRVVYLARTDSANRRMENEAEVIARLEARGVAIVHATGMPFAAQAAAVRDAALVVAPHGAGLTNLLFTRPGNGPAVIELFQENFLNTAFTKLAQLRGLAYTALVNPLRELGDGRHGSTWVTDLDLLERTLDAVPMG